MKKHFKVLSLDSGGLPKGWLEVEEAIIRHANGKVSWQLGEDDSAMFRGGINRISGLQSSITTAPIIALSKDNTGSKRMSRIPGLNNRDLFRRDNHTCAYCNTQYRENLLTRDHIHPTSRGGENVWMNVITACKACNNFKGNWLLSEIDMDLHFLPYIPNHAEGLILENYNILPCQVEYLMNFVPANSRLDGYLSKLKHLKGIYGS